MIPNRVLLSKELDAYEKVIFCLIAMCGKEAFPSYPRLMEWSGMSRDKVWKSLKTLEKMNLIQRFRKQGKIYYVTWWSSLPDGLIGVPSVRYTDWDSPPDRREPVRQTDPIKIKEQENLKREFLEKVEDGEFLRSLLRVKP